MVSKAMIMLQFSGIICITVLDLCVFEFVSRSLELLLYCFTGPCIKIVVFAILIIERPRERKQKSPLV